MACADAGFAGDPETLVLQGLTAGTTYYMRVYSYDGPGGEGSYTLMPYPSPLKCKDPSPPGPS